MIKNYKLFGEVHKMVYFVEGIDIMGNTKRYMNIEEVRLEDLLHKDFLINRDCKLIYYRQFGEIPLSEESLSTLKEIRYGGYVNPIVKIKDDIIYVSTIIDIDNTEFNNYSIIKELLEKINEKKNIATTGWMDMKNLASNYCLPEKKEEKKSFFTRLKGLIRGNKYD